MKKRILVVEDNLLNLELVTDLLEAGGFVVCHAHSAEEGFRAAHELPPDLILMDLSLPGLDGLAATRALRANPATRHLTIIALTAHAMKGDEAIALRAGCDGYLAKPFDTRTFAANVTAFIAAADCASPNPTLPANMQTETLIRNKSSSARALGCRGLVLVVDDEEANRMLLRDPLETHGYETVEAENGEQALQQVEQRPPDVILLDVMIPRLDGFEVCRRLKKAPARPLSRS